MTTKKQRREETAAKTAARRETDRLNGLELQRIDREKRERRLKDMERAEKKKATALAMRKTHEAAEKKEEIPDNLLRSVEALTLTCADEVKEMTVDDLTAYARKLQSEVDERSKSVTEQTA